MEISTSSKKTLVHEEFPLAKFQISDEVEGIALSPNGELIAAGSSKGDIIIWNISHKQKVRLYEEHPAPILSIVFSPDGRFIASAAEDGSVSLWCVQNGIRLWRITGSINDAWYSTIDFSPDGTSLLTGLWDNVVTSINVSSKKCRKIEVYPSPILSARYSSDGSMIASGARDGTVLLWNVLEGKIMWSLLGHKGGVTSLSFSSNRNLIATTGSDKTVRLWNVLNGEREMELINPQGIVITAAFSPDGKLVASASEWGSIILWDANEGKILEKFIAHSSGVSSLAFSKDGKSLFTGSYDMTIKVWNLTIN